MTRANTVIGYREIYFSNLRSLHVRSYLWCFRFTDSQHFSEVGVHGVVSFTFSFWRFNPVMHTTGLQLEKNKQTKKNKTEIHLTLQNVVFTQRSKVIFTL